jgi:hypothetical protein
MSGDQPGADAGGGGGGGRLMVSPRARGVLFALGCAWEAGRFLLVLRVMDVVVGVGAGHWLVPWLVFGASGSLLTAACAALLAVLPARHAAYLGLLRLGKVLSLFSFVLLALSGGLAAFIDRPVAALVGGTLPLGPVMVAVFALDLLFLALYAGLRVDTDRPVPDAEPGEYNETEVGHYH